MKKILIRVLLVCLPICLFSCQGDVNTDLKGKSFRFLSIDYGIYIYQYIEFQRNGNVYHKVQLDKDKKPYTTDGCSLYYKMDGTNFTVYYGVKGWKKEVRHTEYLSGTYYNGYVIIDGDKYTEL